MFDKITNSKLHSVAIAVIATILGCLTFPSITKLGFLLSSIATIPEVADISYWVFLILALIDQIIIGFVFLILLKISKRYYSLIFACFGYLGTYSFLTYNNYKDILDSQHLYPFNPVIISTITLILLTIGLRYFKKFGLILAIIINVLFLASFNYYVATNLDFHGWPFSHF